MINPDFTLFDDNMFIQVRQLLGGVSPDSALPVIDVTVGEPRIAPPDILSHTLNEASANWQAYPKAFADQQFLARFFPLPYCDLLLRHLLRAAE